MGRLALFDQETDNKYLTRIEVYKKKFKLSYRDIAKLFNLDVALIYRYCNEERRPRLKTAKMIEEKTNGFIKPKHWGLKDEND